MSGNQTYKHKVCSRCNLRVIPTKEGLCPLCSNDLGRVGFEIDQRGSRAEKSEIDRNANSNLVINQGETVSITRPTSSEKCDSESALCDIEFDAMISKEDIDNILDYGAKTDYKKKHFEFANSLKKKHGSRRSVTLAINAIVLGIGGTIYGIADVFGGALLPGPGIVFLIGGPIACVWFIVKAFSIRSSAPTMPRLQMSNSLENACTRFYREALLKKGGEYVDTKQDQLMNVCQFFPIPILENYLKHGWAMFKGSLSLSSQSPIECAFCHSTSPSSKPVDTYPFFLRTGEILYYKCEHCSSVICSYCLESPKAGGLCPSCGKATGGIEKLMYRWEACREEIIDTGSALTLSSIDIEESRHNDPRVVGVRVCFTVETIDNITKHVVFNNVALKIDQDWFLVSPEPGKRKDKLVPTKPTSFVLLPTHCESSSRNFWIRYELAEAVDVMISIQDAGGNLIKSLDLGHKPAGFYADRGKAAYWDGRSEAGEPVVPGTYFCTIQAGDFTATRKMIIAK